MVDLDIEFAFGDKSYVNAAWHWIVPKRPTMAGLFFENWSRCRIEAHLIERCHGDDRPDCPILEEFAGVDSYGRGT